MMARYTYDVFLSFRGDDVRKHFLGHLFQALVGRGISTFLDDAEIRGGQRITPTLVKAIEGSRIAIPVFSPHYAASSFCLDELVKIIECAEAERLTLLPVFYGVESFHVRRLRETYGEALANHQRRFASQSGDPTEKDLERMKKWKMALNQAADFSGVHFELGDDSERDLINKIIVAVSTWKRTYLQVADNFVGLKPRVQEVIKLLDVGSKDAVRMIGIHGTPGIGKSTLARAVFNSIDDTFEGQCFLDVREMSIMKHGLVHLQKTVLSKLVGEKDVEITDVNEGMSMIEHSLCQKKVLLIVDNVDKLEQLRAIAGDTKWFGFGSIVIITTRKKDLLRRHKVVRTYEVEELNAKEALDLLTWNAFKSREVDPSYVDVFNSLIAFASGLPLALEVISSNMVGKSKDEWKSALDQYKRVPKKEIQEVLRVSYDDLEEDEQKFFLDIACFFNRDEVKYVEAVLRAHHGVCPKNGIQVLADKSLVKIDGGNVKLHDLIQHMGREIVRLQSPDEPRERSRIWFSGDVKCVFEKKEGSSKIEIIRMAAPNVCENINWELMGMDRLKTLIINKVHFSEGPEHLPKSLRVLEWLEYPSKLLPDDFHPEELAMTVPCSCLFPLNFLEMQEKYMNLIVLNFSRCHCIEQIPDVSGVPNLEVLLFCECVNLVKIHESVGMLNRLRILNAQGCSKLSSFPPISLIALEYLDLSLCSIERFPEVLEKMEKLTTIKLDCTPIKEFPFSIRNFTRLQALELWFGGNGIVTLPSSIFQLTELQHLKIWNCDGLLLSEDCGGEGQGTSDVFSNQKHFEFPSCNISNEFLQIGIPWFVNVKKLDLSSNTFTILPACIKKCRFLRELYLNDCKDLQEIEGTPPNMEVFHAPNCTSLTSLCRDMLMSQDLHEGGETVFWLPMPEAKVPESFYHCRGFSISFWFRAKFPTISLCFVSEQPLPSFHPKLIINDHEVHQFSVPSIMKDHIIIVGQKLQNFKDKVDDAFSQNEWYHVQLCCSDPLGCGVPEDSMQFGLHVFEQPSSTKNVLFTNPLLLDKELRLVDNGKNLAPLEPTVGQVEVSLSLLTSPALNDDVHCYSKSMVAEQISGIASIQASQDHLSKAPGESPEAPAFAETQIVEATSPTLSSGKGSDQELHLDIRSTASPTSEEEFYAFLHAPTHVPPGSDDKSATANPNEEARKALAIVLDFISSNDASVLLHREQCSAMEVSLDFLSNLYTDDGISKEEEKLISEASWLFPRWSRDYIEAGMKIESVTSELERPDELEASLKANKNKFMELHEKLASMEESKKDLEAQKKDLEAQKKDLEEQKQNMEGKFSVIKAYFKKGKLHELEYDGLEVGREGKKNGFGEVEALENVQLQKFASMEKSKMELEEKINAIRAKLSVSESEKNKVVQRKRDIYEEGKKLKSQRDESRKKVPRLQHEQCVAKKTQLRITAEWSELGEKFRQAEAQPLGNGPVQYQLSLLV